MSRKWQETPAHLGGLLLGSWGSIHPLNFLPGSHQHHEITELRKEKSQKVCILPYPINLEKLPAVLLKTALLWIHSQKKTFRATQEQMGVSLMRRTSSALIGVLMFPNGQCWSKSTDLPGPPLFRNPQGSLLPSKKNQTLPTDFMALYNLPERIFPTWLPLTTTLYLWDTRTDHILNPQLERIVSILWTTPQGPHFCIFS